MSIIKIFRLIIVNQHATLMHSVQTDIPTGDQRIILVTRLPVTHVGVGDHKVVPSITVLTQVEIVMFVLVGTIVHVDRTNCIIVVPQKVPPVVPVLGHVQVVLVLMDALMPADGATRVPMHPTPVLGNIVRRVVMLNMEPVHVQPVYNIVTVHIPVVPVAVVPDVRHMALVLVQP